MPLIRCRRWASGSWNAQNEGGIVVLSPMSPSLKGRDPASEEGVPLGGGTATSASRPRAPSKADQVGSSKTPGKRTFGGREGEFVDHQKKRKEQLAKKKVTNTKVRAIGRMDVGSGRGSAAPWPLVSQRGCEVAMQEKAVRKEEAGREGNNGKSCPSRFSSR